jgi:two-component system, OmpR family, sensor histidine kinase ArlS
MKGIKAPVFIKTVGFRLTLWYIVFFFLLGALLIVGFNLTMEMARSDIPPRFTDNPGPPMEIAQKVGESYRDYLVIYSWISLGCLLLLCGVGGYLLSKRMLKPVDYVSTLATRISTNNLKERINYQGPDDEMKRLADTFDSMLSRLEESFNAQNQFIQDASHELRTPIAIAQTNIDVIEMDKNPSNEDYKQLIEVLKLSTERMSQLSNKLLLLSKNQQQITEYSIIDIVSLVNDILKDIGTYAQKNRVNIVFETASEELQVKGDIFATKQAITNLIDNAIKYNRPDGTVKISARKDGQNAVIIVEDNGIGISEENQKHIFDRFFRVDKSRSRAQGGTGLGLAIVKEIIESHKGTITVKSELDAGSTFTISLPLYTTK